jgi:hypothetical protein
LIASGINANNYILALVYALVPIECIEWWQWFLKHFTKANLHAIEGEYVFILDQEKGLLAALEAIFPNAFQNHWCQHICNNVEQRYSVKCRPFF